MILGTLLTPPYFAALQFFSNTPWAMVIELVLWPSVVIYLREPASPPDLGSLEHEIYVVLIWEIAFVIYTMQNRYLGFKKSKFPQLFILY